MRLIKGNPVSRGIAVGKVFVYKAYTCDVHESYFEDGMEAESLKLFEDAVAGASAELDAIINKLDSEGDDKSKIFTAHKEILFDEEILDEIHMAIEDEHMCPDYAANKVFTEFAAILSKAKDPLIAARAADLRDVRNRVLRVLHGEKEKNLSVLPEEVVVVAHDLLPSDTATLDRSKVLGIVTEVGGATSHSAIIARGYRIPAVLGVPDATKILEDGAMCVMDAIEGTVYVRPEEDVVAEYTVKREEYLKESAEIEAYIDKVPLMACGERMGIGLNIGDTEDSDDYNYCDYIGLFRTEFLYMQNDHMPTEEEQYDAYCKVLANAKGRPVTLRTLDIGGDKTLKYMELPKEENPFLGNRALRLCLSNPNMFNTQLRAALRASAKGELWLMFPMVGTIEDIRNGKAAVERAKAELRAEGLPFDENIKVGIMVEIPAIAEIADLAAQEADFASVGTNDLTQYMHAVDRMNAEITEYYQNFSPAVLRMLAKVFSAFNNVGKPVSVCGEMGGDPLAAVVMAGMGLHKMSMSGSNIARVKRILSKFTMEEAKAIAQKVMNMPTQADILAYLQEEADKHLAK